MPLSRRVEKVLTAWEAVQVELQGRYSLQRLRDVLHHAKHSSKVRNGLTVLLTPLPCLVFLVLLDMLPIRPTTVPFAEQTIWVVARLSIVAWVMGFMMSMQIHQSSPTLPYPTIRRLGIPTLVATIIGCCYCGLAVTVGFPVPFGIQLLTPLWFVLLTSMLWDTWKHKLRADAQARADLVSYIPVFVIQVLIVYAYPLYNVVFSSASRDAQPYVAIGLPVMKLIFKNLMVKGVYRMEDLAPSTIVLNMDVFHAMFVSSTMQQAQSNGTTVVIMLTDLIQSMIAYLEVHLVQKRVNKLANECQAFEGDLSTDRVAALASQHALRRGAIAYALHIIDTCPAVNTHPEIESCNDAPSSLTPSERLQLECVKSVLKMLHMIEFYVLIEFAEVLVAAMYTIYMLVIAHLPNRVYYLQLAPLSTDELDARVVQLATYAGLELISFVLFCVVIDRKVGHLSSIQQLAFVLQRHALVVQTTIFMWVFFIVQISFEHFGCDYSFRFAWLHPTETSSAPSG